MTDMVIEIVVCESHPFGCGTGKLGGYRTVKFTAVRIVLQLACQIVLCGTPLTHRERKTSVGMFRHSINSHGGQNPTAKGCAIYASAAAHKAIEKVRALSVYLLATYLRSFPERSAKIWAEWKAPRPDANRIVDR